MEKIEYTLKALTDIWTGDVGGKGDHLKNTGLLGSIRWWFEVLVRGLGGYACDPTNTKCEAQKHCAVCELFGCTGWARKFRFEVLDEKGAVKRDQIKQNQNFILRFTSLRPTCPEENTLLNTTLRLIADYGAIGGKTVLKPSDESSRTDAQHHQDFGLVQMLQGSQLNGADRDDLKTYISKWPEQSHGEFGWASLQHFWCVNGKYLARQNGNTSSFNRVIGRLEPKQQSSQNDSWTAGFKPDRKRNIDPASKRVFSFKEPARTYGFLNPPSVNIDINKIRQKLETAWGTGGWELCDGEKIINLLFAEKEKTQ